MKKFFAIIFFMGFYTQCFAGDAGWAGAFLRSGVGARPLGMGKAFTAVAEGPEAIFFNPAGLSFAPKRELNAGYKALSLDRHLNQIAFSFPVKNEAVMAVSWINAGVSNVVGRGESRQILGEIGNHQNAFSLTFSKAIDSSVSVGATLRYLQEKLDDLETFTVGVDAGVLVKPHKVVSLGLTIENLGSNYRWESRDYWGGGSTYDNKIPLTARFGGAGYLLSGSLITALDIEKNEKQDPHLRIGGEYWFKKKIIKKVEDEYEEGKFFEVEEEVRWACLRMGLDRGSPAFGGSIIHWMGKFKVDLEYAYLIGLHGTSAGHVISMGVGF